MYKSTGISVSDSLDSEVNSPVDDEGTKVLNDFIASSAGTEGYSEHLEHVIKHHMEQTIVRDTIRLQTV